MHNEHLFGYEFNVEAVEMFSIDGSVALVESLFEYVSGVEPSVRCLRSLQFQGLWFFPEMHIQNLLKYMFSVDQPSSFGQF